VGEHKGVHGWRGVVYDRTDAAILVGSELGSGVLHGRDGIHACGYLSDLNAVARNVGGQANDAGVSVACNAHRVGV
jgi:hypothetical protein